MTNLNRPPNGTVTTTDSADNYRLLFESAPLAIFIMAGDHFIECNHKATEIFNRSVNELVGHTPAEFSPDFQPDGQSSAELVHKLQQHAMEGESQAFEWTILWPDGSERLLDVIVKPMHVDQKQGRITYAIAKDITGQRAREKEAEMQKAILKRVSESASEYIYVKDLEGRFIYANQSLARLFNTSVEAILGRDDLFITSGQTGKQLPDSDQEVINAGNVVTYEETIYLDRPRTFQTTKGPYHDADGRLQGVFGISRDVTQQRDAERQADKHYYDLTERVKELSCINLITAKLEDRNGTFDDMLQDVVNLMPDGWRHPQLAAARISIEDSVYTSSRYRDSSLKITAPIIANDAKTGLVEVVYIENVPEPCFLEEEKNLLHLIAGKLGHVVERKQSEAHIKKLAFYDVLTQLPNRQLMMERLQHVQATSIRNISLSALFVIDLDNFKNINDTLGHQMGDRLLQEFAYRLKGNLRRSDTVSRLGGDEFVVILENLAKNNKNAVNKAKRVAEKILESFSEPFKLAGNYHFFTASIGIVLFGRQQKSEDELLKQADIAMYQAKSSGRNTFRMFDPVMQSMVAKRAVLETDLRNGLENDEFFLCYQPQFTNGGEIVGCEALLRWQHPTKGVVSPAEFIPVAEETGQILALGQWVFESVCKQMVVWDNTPCLSAIKVSVNVSVRQFYSPEFVKELRTLISETGAKPGRLKLELTETLLHDSVNETTQKMNLLKQDGIEFSLDDFGTGYSSLTYLKQFPLDEVKIDQSFIEDVLTNSKDAAIVRIVIALGKSLGLQVVAEGVENEEQRTFLEKEGCRIYQGYLLGKPMRVPEFETFCFDRLSQAAATNNKTGRHDGDPDDYSID